MADPAHPADLPRLPARPAGAHKGDFGYVLVLGGSRGMAGAVVLTARSAMRAGAGKVTAAVPEDIYTMVASQLTVCTTSPFPDRADGTLAIEAWRHVAALAGQFHVVALGPGLGQSEELVELVARAVREMALPMVIDADGLNCLAPNVDAVAERTAPTVLTPHPKEMSRLTGVETGAIQADRTGAAASLAARLGAVVVLKGHETVVAGAGRTYVNPTGNPGMATGGSGDVLTGVIAALVSQGMEPFDAAALGVYVHGLAGDLARDAVGEVSLIATDILDHLPAAFRQVGQEPV